jgi:hypothetical protein
MSIFSRVTKELTENKKKREDGKLLSVPWQSLPKLCTVVPGVQKGRYCIVTANSKVGKTQLADFLYLYEPLDFMINNPNSDIKLKIFYFSLEMSKEDKVLQMIANKIYKDTGEVISTDNLRSYFSGYILEDRIQTLISSYKAYFDKVEEIVSFVDNIRNPYGIYKEVRQFARKNGKFYKNDGSQVDVDSGDYYDYYVPDDENLQVIVIVDHYSLLQPEKIEGKQQTLWDAMFKFSSDYALRMRDKFKYTIVGIQQQAADQEKQQFTFKGDTLVDKLRPSADGLADCKLTGRDCDLMIGLFSPFRYRIAKYPEKGGYDISKLKDNYRELSIIFNRRGGGSVSVDLYFDGAVNYFKELPDSTQINYSSL